VASHLLAKESSLIIRFWSGSVGYSLTPASDKEGAHIAGRSSDAARTMTDVWRTDSMPTTTATDVPDRNVIIMFLNSICY
jgi:hypothetical protein